MTIQEGNKAIAEFENLKIGRGGRAYLHESNFYGLDELRYHSSWDWLMPVVEKIEWLDSANIDCRVSIERQECKIFYHSEEKKYEWLIGGHPKMESVWMSVVKFIQWYQKKEDNP